MKTHRDAWNGFALEMPDHWRTHIGGDHLILAGDGAEEAVMIWSQSQADLEQACERVGQLLAGQDPTFHLWSREVSSREKQLMFSRQGDRLRGLVRVESMEQGGGVLATGYQGERTQLADRRQTLERILASFQWLPPIPRQVFVDPSEGAFSVMVPQGWKVQGGVDRRRNPRGDAAVYWVVEDPRSQARVAQESLVIDMVSGGLSGLLGWLGQAFEVAPGSVPPGLQFAGLPLQLFQGQHAWKAQPFLKVDEFCHKVLLPLATPLRPGLKLEAVLHDLALDGLARQMLAPVEQQVGARLALETGLVLVTYAEQGQTFRECSILVNWAMPPSLGGQYWFCSMGPVLRAPLANWEEMAPLLEGVARSFEANTAWEGRQVAAAAQRMTEERLRAEAERARILKDTLDYCNRVNEEIRHNREVTQAEIDRGRFNLIAGKEDLADASGSTYKVDSGWDQYWLKNGEIVGSRSTDLDTHLEANGWSRLRIF